MVEQDLSKTLSLREQLAFYFHQPRPEESVTPNDNSHQSNKLNPRDRAFHDWYRFVLSYPPHLVRDYLQRFGLRTTDTVLDLFCGTGTTIVEAKLNGIQGIGLEANPFAHFASSVKVDWSVDPDHLMSS